MDDTTNVTYECPFCDTTSASEHGIRQHINKTTDSAHKGYSYDVDRTVKVKHPSVIPDTKFNELEQTIVEAGEKINKGEIDEYDELSNDAIKSIADEADVHHSFVLYALEENDVQYRWYGKNPTTRKEDLSEHQRNILREFSKYDADSHRARINDNLITTKISKDLGYDSTSCTETLEYYSWMVDVFDFESHTEKQSISTQVSSDDYDDATSKMLDNYNGAKQDQDTTTDSSITINDIDEQFAIIASLIRTDKKELAKELMIQLAE